MIRIELTVRNILAIAGVALALWLLVKVWGVLLLTGVALLLAAALLPYVERLRRRTGNRTVAVLLVVFGVLAAVTALLVLVVPPMVTQGRDLWQRAPEWQARAAGFAERRGWQDLGDKINEFQPAEVVGPRLLTTGRTVASMFIAWVTTFFLTAYILVDARRLKGMLYYSTPRAWHRHIRALLPALQRVVGGYIRGQAITSGSIFVFTFVVLTVAGVPNAIALAALAAIADLIPLVGVYILIALVALPALMVSPSTAVIVVVAMVVYQQFEDRILIPRVYGATLRLPALAVVLSILIGAELLGLVGALLALPVAATIRVVAEYFVGVRGSTVDAAIAEVAPAHQPFAPDSAGLPPAAAEGHLAALSG